MTTAAPAVRCVGDDRGAGYIAAFIVLLPTLLLAGVGILVDSGRYYTAYRQADAIAMEAARAGANALDANVLGAGGVAVDPAAAQVAAAAAAGAYVTSTGHRLAALLRAMGQGRAVSQRSSPGI